MTGAIPFWHLITRPRRVALAPAPAPEHLAEWRDAAGRLADLVSPALAAHLLVEAEARLGVALVPPERARQSRLANRLTRHGQLGVARRLAKAGIDAVYIKGFANAHLLYPDPDIRCFGDLDLLAREADAARVRALLAEDGFAFAGEAGPAWGFQSDASYPPYAAPDGSCNLDIHVRADAFPAWRSLTVERIFAAARTIAIDGLVLRVPAPEHAFLLCVTNAAKDKFGPFAVRKIADAIELLRQGSGLDWDRVAALAAEGGLENATRGFLALLRRLGLEIERLPCGAPPPALDRAPAGHARRTFERMAAAHLALSLDMPGPRTALAREFLLAWNWRDALRLNLRRVAGLLGRPTLPPGLPRAALDGS
ncbi:MAG: nucleotidyltransferase family protein [Alphaproteobacteria bacterium]